MINNLNVRSSIRWVSSILLLFSLALQFLVALLLAADIDECFIEDIHEINGFIIFGLMFIHILVFFKKTKSLFGFKTNFQNNP